MGLTFGPAFGPAFGSTFETRKIRIKKPIEFTFYSPFPPSLGEGDMSPAAAGRSG